MTPVNPAARPGASQQAAIDAALLLVERMGLFPADLQAVPQARPQLPTFAECLDARAAYDGAGVRWRLPEPGLGRGLFHSAAPTAGLAARPPGLAGPRVCSTSPQPDDPLTDS